MGGFKVGGGGGGCGVGAAGAPYIWWGPRAHLFLLSLSVLDKARQKFVTAEQNETNITYLGGSPDTRARNGVNDGKASQDE